MPSSMTIVALLAAISVKTLAVVAMGFLATLGLRRASAACRHVLWTAVLGSVLLIVLAAPLPAAWSLPAGVPLGLPGTTELDAPAAPRRAALEVSRDVPTTAAHASERPRRMRLVGDVLVSIWIAGVAVLTLRAIVGRIALRRIGVRSRTIQAGPAHALLQRLDGRSSAPGAVRLIETDALRAPATWGVFRPVIALPAASWPEPSLEAALRHEIAHVRRHDALTQLFSDLSCGILWFHPAVWAAARRMRAERERACDDAVLAAGEAGVDYAELLLSVAAEQSRHRSFARSTIAMARGQVLEERLRAVLDPTTARSSPRLLTASIPALALILAATIAGLDVWAKPFAGMRASDAGAQLDTPGDADLLLGERVPFEAEEERRALGRRFRPRDEREAQAIERLRGAAAHEPQHAMDLVHDRAVWALSVAAEDRVVEPLLAELDSADWRVRGYAAWSLGVVGAPEAREALTRRLADPAWRVRAMAAESLAALADPRSTEDMLSILDDPAWQVRVPAVEYLSRIRTPAALAAIRIRLHDPHVAVRSAAEAALEESRTQ